MELKKGDRVTARWYVATDASLPGMQVKAGATEQVFTGEVVKIMGDRPVDPTSIMITLSDGQSQRQIKPEWIEVVHG